MTTETLIHTAGQRLPSPRELAYDDDGELVGLAYLDPSTRRAYAVGLEACQALVEMPLGADSFGGDTGDTGRYLAADADAYSRWCALPEAQPEADGDTLDAAIDAAGWHTSTEWHATHEVA